MPIFKVQGPDGYTYSVEAPEGTSPALLQQAIQEQGSAAKQQARNRSYTEALVTDPAASIVKGLGSLAQFPAQLYGLATGDMDTALNRAGAAVKKYGEEMQSPGLQMREAQRAAAVQEAEKRGQLSAFGTAFGETVKDPALISSFLLEQVPQLLVPFGGAKVAQGASLARSAMAGVPVAAGAQAAQTAAYRTALGLGALQQGADVGAESYEELYKELIKQQIDPATAKQMALDRARAVGASASTISLLAQKLPGAKTIEQTMAKVPLSKAAGETRLGAGIKGLLGESASEVAEEVGGKFASNVAMQNINPEASLASGLGATAAMAAIGGGTMGGVLGLLRKPEAEAPPAAAQSGNISTPAPGQQGQLPAGQPPAGQLPPGQPPAMPPPVDAIQKFVDSQTEEQQKQMLAALEAKAKGTPDKQVPGPDGKLITIPGTPPEFLQPVERIVYQLLRDKFAAPAAPTAPTTTPPTGAAPTAPTGAAPTPPGEAPPTEPTGEAPPTAPTGAAPTPPTAPPAEPPTTPPVDTTTPPTQFPVPPTPEPPPSNYLATQPLAENTEARMWQAKSGMYGVGLWDNDGKEFVGGITFWPNQQNAQAKFDDLVSKSLPAAPTGTAPSVQPTPSRYEVKQQYKDQNGVDVPAGWQLLEDGNWAQTFATKKEADNVKRALDEKDNLEAQIAKLRQSQDPGVGNQIESLWSRKQRLEDWLSAPPFNTYPSESALSGGKEYRPKVSSAPTPTPPSQPPVTPPTGAAPTQPSTTPAGAPTAPAATKPPVTPPTGEAPAGKPAVEPGPNKIFTDDAAEKARRILNRKLGGTLYSGGLDPEIIQAGITLAGYHIEKGARTFAAYVRAMFADIGDIAKPYLKSWYMGVKFDPRAADLEGLDSSAAVEAADVDAILAEEPAEETPTEEAPPADENTERVRLANKFLETFQAGQGYKTIVQARIAAAKVLGRPIEAGTADAKLVDEAVELAGVLYGRDVFNGPGGILDKYNALQQFQQNQMPSLNVRDSTSIINQAYSTPLPLAFAAIELGMGVNSNYRKSATVLEPTAGQGALLIGTDPKKATVNEINPDRVAALQSQGFTVTQEDAGSAQFPPKSVNVVLANPPYGTSDKSYTIDDYTTTHRDHAISLNALQAMKDDGSAVLLIGGPNKLDDDSRQKSYRAASKRSFFHKLYNEYNVVDHFTVAGDLYAKQGTTYPVDVIVIDGRRANATRRNMPAAALPRIIETWDQLEGVLDGSNIDMGPFGGSEAAPGGDTGTTGTGSEPQGVPTPPSGEGAGSGGQGGRSGAKTSGESAAPSGPAGGTAGPGGGGAAPGAGEPIDQGDIETTAGAGAGTAKGAGEEQPGGGAGVPGGGAAPVGGTAAAGAPRARLTEEQTQKLQVPYINFSRSFSVNTLVATNHLTPIVEAFERLEDAVGNIDDYVANKLQYLTPESGDREKALQSFIQNNVTIADQRSLDEYANNTGIVQYPKLYPGQVVQWEGNTGVVIGRERVGKRIPNGAAAVLVDGKRIEVWPRTETKITQHVGPVAARIQKISAAVEQYVFNSAAEYELQKYFSAEQVEALALAIYNIEANRGFIIGDQTGIGKGRVVAGMIRYAMLHNKIPVFVTQMPDLYGDIMRDLNDIGMPNVRPLMTDNKASVPLDAEALQWYGEKQEIEADILELRNNADDFAVVELGDKFAGLEGDSREKALNDFLRTSTNSNVVALREQIAELKASIPERRGKFLDTPDNKRHEAALAQMMQNNSLGNYDAIFTTYRQMDPKSSGKTKRDKQHFKVTTPPELYFRHQFLDQFINENTMLIMDESHNIGKKSPPQQSTGRGNIVRGYINKAGGVFYSSATFAKNVDVLDAYNKTDIGMAFPGDPQRLIDSLSSIPMQQAVSAMLVEATQYLRRERSYEGISYTNETVEVDQAAAEDLSTAMRLIVQFDQVKAQSVRALQTDLDLQGEVMEDGSIAVPEVESINFTSVMHNVLGTFLLSLKARETGDLAIAAIKRGEKPVITVSNTMESFIMDYAEANNIKIGNVLDASFADVLMRYLEKVRTVKIEYPNGQKLPHYLTDEELGPEALTAYEEVADFIREMGQTLSIPISPIDAIKERIEEAGYSIGEITGRQAVVSTQNGVSRLQPRKKSELRTAGKKNTIAKFNDGAIDSLIINRSGSTGLSMHSSVTFADQRRRMMIIAQAEADINNHVQMLGRINRTGQVTEDGKAPDGMPAVFGLPYYIQLSADVPIELRPAAVLANKMAALSANTTAGRKTATQDVKTPDFMNKYGDRVAAELVGNNDELNELLGRPIRFDQDGNIDPANAMAKVTGRIGLLPLKQQNELYGQLVTGYNELLNLMESLGQNDLEAKAKQLDAKLLETVELQPADEGSSSPFASAVILHKVDAKRLTKPLTRAQVRDLIDKALNGRTKTQRLEEQRTEFFVGTTKQIEDLTKAFNELEEVTDDKRATFNKDIQAIREAQVIFRNRLPPIGETVSLNNNGAILYGAVVGVQKKNRVKNASSLSDWEVKFAVLGGATNILPLRLSQIANSNENEVLQKDKIVWRFEETAPAITEDGSGIEQIPIVDAFDRAQNRARETRYIITGNLLRGKQAAGGGNLVSYTDDQGNLLQGFLMPVGFDAAKLIAQQAAAIMSPQAAMELADLDGEVVDKLTMGNVIKFKKYGSQYQIEFTQSGVGRSIVKDFKSTYFASVGQKMRGVLSPETATEILTKILSGNGYGINLVANINDAHTKRLIDARGKPATVRTLSVVPIEPVTQRVRPQTKRRIKFLNNQHNDGVIGDTAFIEGVKTALDRDEAAQEEKEPKERVRGADYIRERLLRARRQGLLSDDGVELALWFIGQNPSLVDRLGISIRESKEEGVAGEYNSISEIMRLVPQAANDFTVVHEILHHLERMMPPDIQKAIRNEWVMQFTAAKRRAATPNQEKFFDLLSQYHFGDPMLAGEHMLKMAKEMIQNGDVPLEFYQYFNPSEFWAVNGSRIVGNRFVNGESLIARMKQWLKEFMQKIKSLFNLPSDASLIRALDSLAKGDGQFKTSLMLFEGDVAQSVVPTREAVIDAAQKFLQKRKPLNPADFDGVTDEFMQKAQPIYAPQRATIIDKVAQMKDGFWRRLAQGIADQYRTIKDYSEHAYMLARMSRTVDGALEGLLFHGQVFLNDGALDIRENSKGLFEVLQPVGAEVDRFLMWMALNREAQLMKTKRQSKMDDMPFLIQHRDELVAGDLDGEPRLALYTKVRNELNKLNRSVLQVALAQGLITSTEREIANTWSRTDLSDEQKAARVLDLEQNPIGYERFANDIWYVPFYREMEDGMLSAAMDSSGLPNQYFSHKIEGGDSPFGDLVENIVKNWNHILSASMKNRAAFEVAKAGMDQNAVVPSLKQQYVMRNNKIYLRSNDELVGDGSLQGWMTTRRDGDVASVKIMIDGIPAYVQVVDPMLFEAISSIGYMGPKSKFVSAMRDFKNLLQYGVTLSPAFKVRNLFRDSVQATAISGGGLSLNPWTNVIQGWKTSDKSNPRFISALAGGAVFNFGSMYEGDQAKLVKRLVKQGVPEDSILNTTDRVKNGLMTAWQKYQDWGNKSEAANRMALYNQLRDKGYNHLEASFMARDLLDFSMQGSWGAMRFLTQTVPFLNARVQGLYKLGRDGISPTVRVFYNTMTGQPIEQSDKEKATSFTTVTSAVVLASLALYFAFKDDEEFKKRDAWDRDNFWWFKLPGMEYALRIPKPFEIGAFGTLAERVAEQIFDQGAEGKQFEDTLRRMMSDTFSLNPTPQMFKPLVDLYSNKDSFTGAPIESAGMERLSKEERKTDNTSPLAIAVSGIANLFLPTKAEMSPVQAEYAIKAYFGWLGGTIAWASKHAMSPFQEGAYPSEKWMDIASVGFIKSLPSTQSEYVTSFYENAKGISEAYADMRHYAAIGDSSKVQAILEDKGDKVALAKMYDQTSKQMAKVRQYIRVVTEDTSMSAEDKRENIDRSKLLIIELARQAEEVRKSMKK